MKEKVGIDKKRDFKKKRVLFFYPACTSDREYHWFPFPFMHMANVLRENGFDVLTLDARVRKDWRDFLRKELSDTIFLGVTVMTGDPIVGAIEVSKLAKKIDPSVPVVWGGYHPTLLPDTTLREDYIDIVALGEAEATIVSLTEALLKGKGLECVKNIAFKKDGKVIFTEASKSNILLQNLPFPAYDLLDIDAYRSGNNIAAILALRGCKYRCSFCNTGMRRLHFRAVDQVIEEIEVLVKRFKFTSIFFHDSVFFISKKRTLELAEKILKSNLNILWKAKAKANMLQDYSYEELKLLKRSGLISIFIGVESGSQRILDLMDKDTTVKDSLESAKICRDLGFEYYASFMYAVYKDSVESLDETIGHIDQLKKINPDMIFQNCIYQPLPGSLMYEQVVEEGYLPPGTLEGWASKNVTSNFEGRDDITWIDEGELKKYIEIWNQAFGSMRSLRQKEKAGEYIPPLRRK